MPREPEPSKAIMAASIIAVRETPAQAAVLGISTAIGHSLIVCIIALVGL
jgi:nickel/cobalt exporter